MSNQNIEVTKTYSNWDIHGDKVVKEYSIDFTPLKFEVWVSGKADKKIVGKVLEKTLAKHFLKIKYGIYDNQALDKLINQHKKRKQEKITKLYSEIGVKANKKDLNEDEFLNPKGKTVFFVICNKPTFEFDPQVDYHDVINKLRIVYNEFKEHLFNEFKDKLYHSVIEINVVITYICKGEKKLFRKERCPTITETAKVDII